MTLLCADDIRGIDAELTAYDRRLQRAAGTSLQAIACAAAGLKAEPADPRKVVCIPLTCGQGEIEGFGRILAAIATHLGFEAQVTASSDAAGLAEAYESKAEIVLTADDHRFVAVHTRTLAVIDNGDATGSGFAYGLDKLAGGVSGRSVLVIGCGPVGRSACLALIGLGAEVALFDRDDGICQSFVSGLAAQIKTRIQIVPDLAQGLKRHRLLFDATPASDLIEADMITPDTYVAAPGVPCGLTSDAQARIGERLLHDPLQLGTATMLMCAVASERQKS